MRVIRELSYLSIDDHAWLNAIRLIWFVISRLSRRKTKDGNWRKTGKRNGVFAGRNLHIEILKGTNFSRSNRLLLPSSSKSSLPPFHGSRFIPPWFAYKIADALRHATFPPLLSFLPRLLFHLPRPSFIASPPPFLPWPCEKCPKVSNNVTRFSKTSASVLETLFVEFPPCVFFFVFFTLSPPSLFSIQISSKHTRATDYKPLCTLSRGGNYWNEPCVVMTRLEMKFNWPDEKQNTRCVAVCARVRGTCVMIVTDRENSFAASCNFSSSPFLLHIYWKYKNGRFKTRSSSNDKFPFFSFFFIITQNEIDTTIFRFFHSRVERTLFSITSLMISKM